jgi:hypothetical protein
MHSHNRLLDIFYQEYSLWPAYPFLARNAMMRDNDGAIALDTERYAHSPCRGRRPFASIIVPMPKRLPERAMPHPHCGVVASPGWFCPTMPLGDGP